MVRAGQGRVRTFSYFSSCVRMTEKAGLPKKKKKRQKGEAHHLGLRDNFHVLPLPASGKRKWGKRRDLLNEVLPRIPGSAHQHPLSVRERRPRA